MTTTTITLTVDHADTLSADELGEAARFLLHEAAAGTIGEWPNLWDGSVTITGVSALRH